MQLITGQKIALSPLIQQELQFSVQVQCRADFEVDVASFALGQNDQLYHDDYMTFYNQPQTPQQEIHYRLDQSTHIFEFELKRIDAAKTPRFVICATVAQDHARIQDLQQGQIDLLNRQGHVVASYVLNLAQFSQEKAVMLLEIYYKNNAWRVAAIGQGFNGGLKALVEYFGAKVAEDNIADVHQPPSMSGSSVDLKKKVLLDKVEKSAAHLLDLTKKSLISLEKNQLLNVSARVALVLDYSGSMAQQYKRGDVQKVIDRIMPLALNFDDDGCFECWAFAEKALRLSDIQLTNLQGYIASEQGGYKKWNAGAGYNNEPCVLEAVIEYFTQQHPSQLPVYVVFISDGGVSEAAKIKKILQGAAQQPIFWQFVGIGGRNYGVLEKLDSMTGRVVDNCNFFAIDRIDSLPDVQLYDLLLQEFPLWLQAAKAKNIIRG